MTAAEFVAKWSKTELTEKSRAAAFAAYGWPVTLSDEELLAKLLALNLERAKGT